MNDQVVAIPCRASEDRGNSVGTSSVLCAASARPGRQYMGLATGVISLVLGLNGCTAPTEPKARLLVSVSTDSVLAAYSSNADGLRFGVQFTVENVGDRAFAFHCGSYFVLNVVLPDPVWNMSCAASSLATGVTLAPGEERTVTLDILDRTPNGSNQGWGAGYQVVVIGFDTGTSAWKEVARAKSNVFYTRRQ